jgi:nucleotidyltransferase/DNA polymerase involved in DNA repair
MKNYSDESFPQAILHLDADAFFASVEVSKNPKLRGKAVITGHERGIATSMSYEAKRMGIGRGMPVYQIRKEFPEAVIVHSDYEAYAMYSKRMFEIVRRYTDLVEEYSIDECFADITNYQDVNNMSYEEIIKNIQRDIEIELNISVSIGVAPTKVLAKTASKWQKPHGITLIPTERITEVLAQIPIGDIWGIGYRTAEKLRFKEITTAGKFASLSEDEILDFAHKPLIQIWQELNGHYIFQITTEHELQHSISKTLSFIPHKTDRAELFSELVRNVENACIKARRNGLVAYRVSWYLKTKEKRYQSNEFVLDTPTNSPNVILNHLREQFDKTNTTNRVYRSTGINLTRLIKQEDIQEDLFGIHDPVREKEELFKTIDILSSKYGRHIVALASGLKAHKQDEKIYHAAHSQKSFFEKIKKTGKELCIPYLGEAV